MLASPFDPLHDALATLDPFEQVRAARELLETAQENAQQRAKRILRKHLPTLIRFDAEGEDFECDDGTHGHCTNYLIVELADGSQWTLPSKDNLENGNWIEGHTEPSLTAQQCRRINDESTPESRIEVALDMIGQPLKIRGDQVRAVIDAAEYLLPVMGVSGIHFAPPSPPLTAHPFLPRTTLMPLTSVIGTPDPWITAPRPPRETVLAVAAELADTPLDHEFNPSNRLKQIEEAVVTALRVLGYAPDAMQGEFAALCDDVRAAFWLDASGFYVEEGDEGDADDLADAACMETRP